MMKETKEQSIELILANYEGLDFHEAFTDNELEHIWNVMFKYGEQFKAGYSSNHSSSQFIKDYKQYKENLKFLGGETEWTFEKTSNLNVELFETIKGFHELISLFDSVLLAYEEGAKEWEERCLKAEAAQSGYSSKVQEGLRWVDATEKPKKLLHTYYCKVYDEDFKKEYRKQVLITLDGQWQTVFKVLAWLDESSTIPSSPLTDIK